MDSVQNMMKTENKCRTKFRDEMDSMKMAMERTTSIPMKQKIQLPASKQSLVRMREPGNPCDVATTSTADRIKVPTSKIPVGLVPLPNVKAVTAKVATRSNIRHKPHGDHVTIFVDPQAQLKQHADQNQHMSSVIMHINS
jgi:hypothetical protein